MSRRKKTPVKRMPTVHVCGPSRAYYYGDPRPPKDAGYFDFFEWQEAQLRKRLRPRRSTRF